MRHSFKQVNIIMAAMLALLLVLPVFPTAAAADASGTCGSGVEWSLSGGVLTISGSGDMADYGEFNPAPWDAYGDSILSVKVEEGVTSVGDFAFFMLDRITSVTLPDSLAQVGEYAFYGCSALELLDLGGVEVIGESAFERCTSLVSVRLPSTLTTLGREAFYRCESLLSITIPASVTDMGNAVFTYCSSLRSATVLANISQLPVWTFYGCYELETVSMASTITSVGVDAFHDCEVEEPVYSGGSVRVDHTSSSTTQQGGAAVTTDRNYTESTNSTVSTQTTTTTQTGGGKDVSVEIDAVLENPDGWEDVEDKVNDALFDSGSTQVTVNLKGEPEISGEDLGRFAGKDVELTIRTSQGAVWHVDGSQISSADLAKSYDLSFTLTTLTDPTGEQSAAVGNGRSFVVVFHNDIDFKVEVELPLGTALARDTAVFFSPNGEDGYDRMQAVVIDTQGVAHFYLAQVQKDVEYLIGINIPNQETDEDAVSDAIIPDTMENEYPNVEQVEEIQYVVTGVKSSWGMDIGQVTWILAAVMIGSVIVVGVVVGILYRMKVKRGYVPDMSYADENE